MASFTQTRKLSKAVTEDVVPQGGGSAAAVSSGDIRKLFKALSNDPALLAALRACKTPAEKHQVIRQNGLTPVTGTDLKLELAKCLHPTAFGGASQPEDDGFLDDVLHLASASSTDFVTS